jgi:hypothetical protein
MKLKMKNRSISGHTVRVLDPVNGKELPPDTIVDLSKVDFKSKIHYLRLTNMGEMEVYTEPTKTKKLKEEPVNDQF